MANDPNRPWTDKDKEDFGSEYNESAGHKLGRYWDSIMGLFHSDPPSSLATPQPQETPNRKSNNTYKTRGY